jgi:hypothetical protein
MIERDPALGLSGRAHIVAATIVADGMLQCKASEGRVIRGYRVPSAQKESTACSQLQNYALRADGDRRGGTNKSAGIVRDAGGLCLGSR